MPTLPTASTANTESNATIAAETATAQTAFIASTTVLINTAISNGLFQVEPFLPLLVTSAYVTTYFTGLGYTVLFPICGGCNCSGNSGYPYEPCFVAGFPEALPPGYIPWNCDCGFNGPARIQISWPPFPVPPPCI